MWKKSFLLSCFFMALSLDSYSNEAALAPHGPSRDVSTPTPPQPADTPPPSIPKLAAPPQTPSPAPQKTVNKNVKKEAIKISCIFNTTGKLSSIGIPGEMGAKLAVSEINQLGGVLGRSIELVQDNPGSNIGAIDAISRKIASDPSISIVMGINHSETAEEIIPLLAPYKKLIVISGATYPNLPSLAPGFVLMVCFGDNTQAAAGAQYAYNKLGAKTAYLLVQNNDQFSEHLAHYFKQSYQRLNGKILLEDRFDVADSTLNAQIARLKALPIAPELIYLAAKGDSIPLVISKLRNAGFHQYIFGGDSFDAQDMIAKIGAEFSGIYFTAHADMSPNNPDRKVQKFLANFQLMYKVSTRSSFAGLGYDTVFLIAKAIQAARTTESTKVREAFLQIKNYNGVTGMISYINNNPIPLKTVFIISQSNGERTLVDKVIPTNVPKY